MKGFNTVVCSFSFDEYLSFCEALVAAGRTSGTYQSTELIEYTKLNLQRMRRWQKTFQVSPEMADMARHARPQTWWVIAEAWCGDGAQVIPQMAAIAGAGKGRITLKILLRDEHPQLMDAYLTNGTRSIPKLIAADLSGSELFTWGPRPAGASQIIERWKQHPDGRSLDEAKAEMHLWYTRNKGADLQQELMEKLGTAELLVAQAG